MITFLAQGCRRRDKKDSRQIEHFSCLKIMCSVFRQSVVYSLQPKITHVSRLIGIFFINTLIASMRELYIYTSWSHKNPNKTCWSHKNPNKKCWSHKNPNTKCWSHKNPTKIQLLIGEYLRHMGFEASAQLLLQSGPLSEAQVRSWSSRYDRMTFF